MKKLFFVSLFCAAIYCFADAQQLRMPAPSPGQQVKQDFGLSFVEVSYSRPGVKGRKIFGDLVPFGKVWRTGANNPTTINIGDTVFIGGTKVSPGKYGLFTIPGENEWTVIISKQLNVGGPGDYKPDQDVVRVKATPQPLSMPVENFLITFNNIKPSSMDLLFLWDRTAVSVPIKTDIDTKILAQIDELMNNDNRPYFGAAMYYMESNRDLDRALMWFDKAIEQNPKAFWVYHQRANLLAKMGKKQDAITSANKSIELAKAAKNDDYVTLNQKLLATLK